MKKFLFLILLSLVVLQTSSDSTEYNQDQYKDLESVIAVFLVIVVMLLLFACIAHFLCDFNFNLMDVKDTQNMPFDAWRPFKNLFYELGPFYCYLF